MTEPALCELCGDPMPAGEEMFKFHGYSGPCPKPPLPGMAIEKDLDMRFDHHPPATQMVGEAFSTMRGQCKSLATWISSLCPEGRERALALTKLEEVMFWANAAIARNQGDAADRFVKKIAVKQ